MIVVAEADRRFLQAAKALDEHEIGPVHQDIAYGWVGHERRQGPHAQRFFQQIVGQPLPLDIAERQIFHQGKHTSHEVAHCRQEQRIGTGQQIQAIHLVEQAEMELPLDRLIIDAALGGRFRNAMRGMGRGHAAQPIDRQSIRSAGQAGGAWRAHVIGLIVHVPWAFAFSLDGGQSMPARWLFSPAAGCSWCK